MSDLPTDALLDARARLAAFVRQRVSDPETADDIVQDTLLSALRAAPELREEEKLSAWLFQIARNAIADHYRREARHAEAVRELASPLDAPTPDDDAALCACFRTLLPTLSPAYAEVIEIVDLESEPSAAAAARLGISRDNLKVRLHRARRQLRERLEATCRTCATHGCLDCSCSPTLQ